MRDCLSCQEQVCIVHPSAVVTFTATKEAEKFFRQAFGIKEEDKVAIDRKVSIIDQRIDKLMEERERLLAMPQDDFEDDAVIFFKKQFQSGGTSYTYVAVKALGSWYMSGPSRANRPMRWEEILEFIDWQSGTTELWHAAEWEQVI